MKALPTIAIFAVVFVCPALGRAEDSPVFFRAGFDGDSAARAKGAPLRPIVEERVSFEKTEDGGSIALKEGTRLEFDLGEGFPFKAGAIEVRFKPNFPQKPDQENRVVFSLLGEKDTGINFGFDANGTRWRFEPLYPGWNRKVAASNFNRTNEQRWNHLVLTWDSGASPKPLMRFYRDGRWDRGRTEPYARQFAGLRRLVIGGAQDLQTNIDEIVVYREALTADDVRALHAAFGQPDRVAVLMRQRAENLRVARAATEAHRALVRKLEGKVAYIINPRGGEQRDFKLPEGIVAKGLRVEDIGKVDLSRFAVIYGPPGGGYQTTKDEDEIIRNYVRAGGGYVGVCAGANYAGKARLLNMTTHSLKNQGLVSVGVKPHPITQGFSGEVMIHHGNGPIMVPGEGCEVVGSFMIGQNFPIVTAAIVAGAHEKGRAVAFGPHPTGGGVAFEGNGTKFSGSELGTDPLLVNALLWAARLTAEPQLQDK